MWNSHYGYGRPGQRMARGCRRGDRLRPLFSTVEEQMPILSSYTDAFCYTDTFRWKALAWDFQRQKRTA
jgi:hypothetical protein